MAEQQDIKVFISWSGATGKAVAVALREWLELLSDHFRPWASDTDIAAGQRGLAQIENELKGSNFGIIVVTAANQHAPWLNFEAGALSKVIAGDLEQRVVPLLVDLAGPAQLSGPLAQFQAKLLDEDGMRDVVRSLVDVAGGNLAVTMQRFDAHWSTFEWSIDDARRASAEASDAPAPRATEEILDEILTHVRSLRNESSHVASVSGRVPRRSYPLLPDFDDSTTMLSFAMDLAEVNEIPVEVVGISITPDADVEDARDIVIMYRSGDDVSVGRLLGMLKTAFSSKAPLIRWSGRPFESRDGLAPQPGVNKAVLERFAAD